jgi:hypothetical protein
MAGTPVSGTSRSASSSSSDTLTRSRPPSRAAVRNSPDRSAITDTPLRRKSPARRRHTLGCLFVARERSARRSRDLHASAAAPVMKVHAIARGDIDRGKRRAFGGDEGPQDPARLAAEGAANGDVDAKRMDHPRLPHTPAWRWNSAPSVSCSGVIVSCGDGANTMTRAVMAWPAVRSRVVAAVALTAPLTARAALRTCCA